MNEEIINTFISSKNRDPTEKSYDFTLQIPDGLIKADQNQYIMVNVISFDMINSMYNVSLKNNKFKLTKNTLAGVFVSTLTYTIPEGNYNVSTLRTILNSLLTGIISVSYNTAQNTYTYTKTDSGFNYTLYGDTAIKLLGISVSNILSTGAGGTIGTYVNMVNYDKIVLRTKNLNYKKEQLDNLSSKNLKISNILLWVSKQDVEPFKMITYNNFDGGNSFCYKIHNIGVDYINFIVENEFNEPILDCPDFTLGIQFSIVENPDKTHI